eukprot:2048326-Alexandrium_andersonii.AAC.1
MSTTRRFVGTTLTKRLQAALEVGEAIVALPTGYIVKSRMVTSKLLPAALYGCPMAPLAAKRFAALRSKVA